MEDNIEMNQALRENAQKMDIEQENNHMLDDNNQEMEHDEQEEQNELMYIYEWVDKIQLSRSKKNIARDFSDGVLLAEIIKTYLPKLVDLHNYPSVSSKSKKLINWDTLNKKVLKKIGLKITKQEIEDVVSITPNAIEKLLAKVYNAIQNYTGINIASGEVHKKKQNDNLSRLKKILAEKQNNIQELNNIIEVLEMKLNSSKEMEKTLEAKVNELSDILRNKGFDV